MLRLKVACVLLLCLTGGTLGHTGDRVYDTAALSIPASVVEYIGEHPEVLNKLREHVGGDIEPRITADDLCSGCLTGFSFLKSLILIGVKWPAIRNDIVNICKVILGANQWKGDIVCPGIIDNFGPLVFDAIKESRKSAKKICIHMNWCDSYTPSLRKDYKRDTRDNGIQHILDNIDMTNFKRRLNTLSETSIKPSHGTAGISGDDLLSVLLGLKTDDLPMISKMLKDMNMDGTIFSQTFSDFMKFASSPETWNTKFPMKTLKAKADYLEKKLQEVMTNVEAKDKLEPNPKRMAELIANALKRQIREKRELPRRRENLLKFVQLADIHIEVDYTTGVATDCGLPVCCRPDSAPGTGSAGAWGNPNCNSSPTTIRKLMRSAAAQNADFVIFTGDNPPHTIWKETLEGQLNASRWVAHELTIGFPNTTVYPNMGNHENYPLNMYYVPREETKALNREWGQMFKKAAKFDDANLETINKAGYYTILIRPGLRIMAYNSNYGGVGNFLNILNYNRPEYLEMISWMRTTLAQARNNSEKVILSCHHEYGFSENVVAFDETILPIFVEYSDIIVLHPVGHVHRDEYRIHFDPKTGKPAGVVFIAMSMTAYPDVNPGYRVWYLDPDTYQPVDYEQYNINLRKANENPGNEDIIFLAYRASEEYGLQDLSPTSMLELYHRIMANDTLLQRYWYLRRSGTLADGICDEKCRQSQQCHIITATFDLYRECMRNQPDVNNTLSGSPSSWRHEAKAAAFGTNSGNVMQGSFEMMSLFILFASILRCFIQFN